MADSVNSNNSTTSNSISLEDLTSLSSISSEPASNSSLHSNISSSNESLLELDQSSNHDLETVSFSTISSSSSSSPYPSTSHINHKLTEKISMLTFNCNSPDNVGKYDEQYFSSDRLKDGRTINISIVREIIDRQSKRLDTLRTVSKLEERRCPSTSEQLKGNDNKVHTITNPEPSPIDSSIVSSISSMDVNPSTLKQFRCMIVKQKCYLDCLQRELDRLQKMEAALSERHHQSQSKNETSVCDCCEKFDHQILADQKDASHSVINPPLASEYLLIEKESSEDVLSECSDDSLACESIKSNTLDSTSSYIGSTNGSNTRLGFRKGKIGKIHDQVDQMILKLHEETTTKTTGKQSVGVQTVCFNIELDKIPTSRFLADSSSINHEDNYKPNLKVSELKQSIAWTIPFTNENDPMKLVNANRSKIKGWMEDNTSGRTLQQAFHEKCDHFLAKSESRVKRINVSSAIRKATAECRLERQLEELIARNKWKRDYEGYGSNKVKVIKPRKVFTEREMKRQTERLYSHLPEIKKSKDAKKREENGKKYQLMAKNFSQRLKNNAVNGKTTFPLTQRLADD